jgi:hypothetical protein
VVALRQRARGLLLEPNDPFAHPKRPQVRRDPPRIATIARRSPSAVPRVEAPADAPQRDEVPQGATTAQAHRRATNALRRAAPARHREPNALLGPATRHGVRATTTRAPVPIERVQRRALDALVLVQATRHALRATTTLAPRARIERVLNRARVDPGLAQRQIALRGTREIASPHRSRPSSVNAKQPASTLVAKAGGASRAKVLSTSRVRDKSSVTPRPNHELLNRRRPGSVLSGRNVRPHPPRRRPARRTRCRPTSRPTYARPSSVRPICARRWCTL